MKALSWFTSALLIALSPVVPVRAQTVPSGPDPVRLQLACDIVAASGGVQAAQADLRSMFVSVEALMKSSMPNVDSRTSAIVGSMMNDIVDQEVQAVPELLDQTARVYADQLTEPELRDLLVYTESATGKSIQAKMPIITRQLIASEGPLMKQMMSGIMSKAAERACIPGEVLGTRPRDHRRDCSEKHAFVVTSFSI